MRRGDIRIFSGSYGVREFDAEDRDTSGQRAMLSGEPVKGRLGTGSNFVRPIENGEPIVSDNDLFVGIVKRDSTETASVDGKVEIDLVGPGSVIEGDATTAASIDTAAELIGLMFDHVAFDVSAASVYTIDEDENGGATTLCLQIVGGDIIRTRVLALTVRNTLVAGISGQV